MGTQTDTIAPVASRGRGARPPLRLRRTTARLTWVFALAALASACGEDDDPRPLLDSGAADAHDGAADGVSADAGDAPVADEGSALDAAALDAPADSGGPDGGTDGDGSGGAPGDMTTHAAAYPFGGHRLKYPDGTIRPTGGQATIDGQLEAYYDNWRTTYLKSMCGGWVIDTGGGTGVFPETFTVSEGHGYAMVITVMMAGYDPMAQAEFDGLYKVFRAFPSEANPGLMAWEIQRACPAMANGQPLTCTESAPGCFRIDGKNGFESSATDGDLDIAFSLLLADKQWGSGGAINYMAEAKKVIAAIKMSEMNVATRLPLLADTITLGSPNYWATRPSDFMIDHFRSYGAATGDAFWTDAVDKAHALLGTVQTSFSPTTGLIPDFLVDTDTTAKPAAPYTPQDEGPATGEYSYNACRVPWRLGVDYIVSGDARAKAELAKMTAWIRTAAMDNPTAIIDGYKLDGTPGSLRAGGQHGLNDAFVAPLGVAALTDASNQAWLDAIWAIVATPASKSYYGDAIKMLSLIAISGNWWAP